MDEYIEKYESIVEKRIIPGNGRTNAKDLGNKSRGFKAAVMHGPEWESNHRDFKFILVQTAGGIPYKRLWAIQNIRVRTRSA